MTKIIPSLKAWQILRQNKQTEQKRIGFVPTMGNLHAGHQSLLERAIKENELTVLSIYINPTQFDDQNDYANYPQTLEQDIALAKYLGISYVIVPTYKDLYNDNYRYKIRESEYSLQMEGRYRSGHFDGVLTVVMKLLNLVKPHKVYFGEKDFQQLQLIKNMVKAFFLDLEVVGCPTIRDVNGLALSSRNARLSKDQYKLALYFPQLLASSLSPHEIKTRLEDLGFVVDYIEECAGRRFGAVKIGDVRLIDNFVI